MSEDRALTEGESEVMEALWRLGEGTVRDVLEALPEERRLAYTSVATFLKILEESGKVWATEQDVRPEIPFHVLFTVVAQQKSTRKNWKIPLFRE